MLNENYWEKLENIEAKEITKGVNRKLFYCENDPRMMIACFEIDPPFTLPIHTHEHEQLGFVLQGKVKYTIGKETKILEKNTFYRIPSNIEHGAEVLGPEKGIFSDIFSPIRKDFLEQNSHVRLDPSDLWFLVTSIKYPVDIYIFGTEEQSALQFQKNCRVLGQKFNELHERKISCN